MTRRKPGDSQIQVKVVQGHIPGLSRSELLFNITCTKPEHTTGKAAGATHLLLFQEPNGFWSCHPRCADHPFAADVPMVQFMWPDAPMLVVQLGTPDPLADARRELIVRIGHRVAGVSCETWFDGREVPRWVHTALNGDQEALEALAAELGQVARSD